MTENLTTAVVHVLPYKIQRKRLQDMKKSMLTKNITVSERLDDAVTHVVSEFESLDQLDRQIAKDGHELPSKACVVSLMWLVECLKASKILPVLDHHRLKKVNVQASHGETTLVAFEIPEWACQRGARLEHFNNKLTDALEVLELHAELRDAHQDYPRALAFRRASCVFKSLPFALKYSGQLAGLKDVGEHVRRVVTDILENGSSSEVKEIVNSEWFQHMKTLTKIFGVGPATAKKWISQGLRTIEDVRQAELPSRDWRVQWGLAFYEDLTSPVSRQEARAFTSIVQNEVEKILPGAIVTLTGGFRRGKQSGHDVDLLITHPSEGNEVDLLPQLLSALDNRGLILVGHKEKNSYRPDVLHQDSKGNMKGQLDHFEKWLGICKFPKSLQKTSMAAQSDQKSSLAAQSDQKSDTAAQSDQKSCLAGQSDSEIHQLKCVQTETETRCNRVSPGQGYVVSESVTHGFQHPDSSAKLQHPVSCGEISASGTSGDNSSEVSNPMTTIKSPGEPLDQKFEPHVKKSKRSEGSESFPAVVARSERDWLARRVDLIVSPYSQYYFALVGWTGSKHFNRDARLYAQKVLGMKLTSHGLYDMKQQTSLPATSEEQVFQLLQLPYLDPTHRNC